MSDITITYRIDQAAALRAGRMCPDHATVALTPETMALCTEQDRAFLAHQVDGGEIPLHVVRGTFEILPRADHVLAPGQDLAFHLWACSKAYRAHLAQVEAQAAEHRARRELQEAEAAREKAALATALADLPPAAVVATIPLSRLHGNGAAEYEARLALRKALVGNDPAMGYAWDHHGHEPPARAAVAQCIERIGAARERRKGYRGEWVAKVVELWGRPVDRERHAAGVLPRGDVTDLVWRLIKAPEGHALPRTCPGCDEALDDGDCTAESGGRVPAAAWDAAQAVVAAFDATMLETMGLCLTRDIVLAGYDCPACEPQHRYELCVLVEHPHNGWTAPPRYYPLAEERSSR